ncbi:autotransporter family protein [Achromobacter deleyi]|uniref:autotransporter family protein n=1 Tax=Achromobacter deleyi TaxID=1353891 RepID=UPI001467AAC6|nr:autotransporter outer membrane beta-barrel domain-containing protein [Achromobacter deleyi]CAB3927878.1 hypothetical protein LMG3412_06067 [Achromobacter deleyi]
MRIALNPIMVGLLTASLPAFSGLALAAERGQVLVNDPAGNTQITLDSGDTVTYTGSADGAIEVSGAGNRVSGDNLTITANPPSPPRTPNKGVRASAGGTVSLTRSTVQTLSDGQANHALQALGANSRITIEDSTVTTRGNLSNGANVQQGGSVAITGGTVTTTGISAVGLWAQDAGSSITVTGADVTTHGDDASGISASNGAAITMNGGSITALGSYAASGIEIVGASSQVSLTNTIVKGGGDHYGARLAGGRLEMDGGSLTGGEALFLGADAGGGPASSALIKNASLVSTGSGTTLDLNAANTSVILENSSLHAQAPDGGGVWLAAQGTQLTANVFDITSNLVGVDNRLGRATLTDGTINTLAAGGRGLYVSREFGGPAVIDATRVSIETQGNRASGAEVRLADLNSTDAAEIRLQDSSVTTHGLNAPGLVARGAYSTLSALNTTVRTTGASSTGLLAADLATTTLDNVRLNTEGAGAVGIWSTLDRLGQRNTVTLSNGTTINTLDGPALRGSGGNHTFQVADATITARAGGSLDNGVLMHTSFLTVNTGQVALEAARSRLTGDVVADNGTAYIGLADGSTLTGALIEGPTGHIGGLTLDATSTWYVRGNSTVALLNNSGTVVFMPPTNGNSFKTVTINTYAGGGTVVLNTQLGDDTSATDKLVIDSGIASRATSLRILNAGGTGGQTQTGIRVVQTLYNATTTADAFHLDAGSTGYRASAQTLALNGYEYSLVRGGNGGVAADWYLTSDFSGVTPPDPAVPIGPTIPIDPQPPVDPTSPVDPATPVTPTQPVAPAVITPSRPTLRNVSPESGAYLGNRLASAQFFNHGRHDRIPAYTGGTATAYAANDVGPDGGGDALESTAANAGRGLWTRVLGRQDSGLRLSQGRVAIDTDSSILQLGGDLVRAPLGQHGAVYAGLMGGYGNARTTSLSALRLPTGATVQARARGKVSGYSVGMYGTVYQNDATRMGAYADTWLQYGRYSNQINSELGSTRYHSTVWSAAVEAGYAIKPFADGSALGPVVIEPHAQLVYSRYAAQDATLQGTRMRSGNDNAWNSRVGIRLYPQAAPNAPAVRPFLEANWLHSFGNPSVNMGPNTLDAALARNSLELKLGAEGRVSRRVQVAGHVFGQAGNNNQRGYGGMLNVGYRW